MSAQFSPTVGYEEIYLREQALRNARTGLLLWRITNGLVFAFFVFANFLMRNVQPSWPPPGIPRLEIGLPIVITLALIVSGVFASRGLAAIRAGDENALRQNLLIAVGLGVAFFVGIVIVTARIPHSGAYSSIILAMNLFHALHVLVGVALLGIVTIRSGGGRYTAANHFMAEGAVVFWHFVDAMWLFFFLVIYVF
ncbi:MAG TPA: cytochrome c oxidase subunit 3 [Aggregatilineales bacterium]|nr:heme-copper oxidase subunit III [Anaerolineales bacterium]HRE49351.1 cytochrome c oxidase subunit 3 [Aggregatilineales bacterium]